MSMHTSNNMRSTYKEKSLPGKLVMSPIQAQQQVPSTAIIAKPAIGHEQERNSNDQRSEATKLWRVLLDSCNHGDLKFARAGEQPIFSVSAP